MPKPPRPSQRQELYSVVMRDVAAGLVVVGNPDEQPDRNGQQSFILDCGLALENLLIQGCALGLTTHAMIGWDFDKVAKAFAIPAPMRPVALVVAGYPRRSPMR